MKDQPLFDPDALGLDAQDWDDLKAAPQTSRCQATGCGRPLRSQRSREAGIGPCCAANLGRAITAAKLRAALARAA